MKNLLCGLVAAIVVQSAWGHAHAGKVDDSMPDVERIRFCERVRDFALQALLPQIKLTNFAVSLSQAADAQTCSTLSSKRGCILNFSFFP